jgi:predicted transcriptional regulator of viral defense system
VSLPQTAEAIDREFPAGLSASRLIKAARRYKTAAVSRRLGFLLELLAGPDAAAPLLKLRGKSNNYVALSPFAPSEGQTNATWRLRINVDPDVLVAHR